MLQGYVQVGQYFALGHQRHHLVNVGVGVDIVQANPYPELSQGLTQFQHAGFHGAAVPKAGAVLGVYAVGAGVL